MRRAAQLGRGGWHDRNRWTELRAQEKG
jgi:hypothetical protein